MTDKTIWMNAVREHLAELIKQTDAVPRYEAMAVSGLFLEEMTQPLHQWMDETDGSEASVAKLEALLNEAQSAMEVDLLQRKGVGELAIERFRGSVVQAISEVLYQTGMSVS